MAKTLIDVLDQVAPRVRRAFLASFRDLKGAADLKRLEQALQAGDIDRALQVLNLRAEFFEPLRTAMREGYAEGGQFTVDSLPAIPDGSGGAAVIRFTGANPRAEQYLANFSGGLITSIVLEQEAAIRAYLVTAMQQQINPRQAALDLIGRYDRMAGRRMGGIIGLAPNQIEFVISAGAELASGEPVQLRNYLTRKTRDARLDGVVRAALKNGKAVDQAAISKMLARMQDRLLKVRGDTIARTEMLAALHASQHEALQQLVDRGLVEPGSITQVWDATGDARTRQTHNLLDGQEQPFGQPFTTVDGYRLMYPGDTTLGAPGSETINCRCWLKPRINFFAGVE